MMSLKFWQRSSLSRKVATLVVLICILTLSLFSIAFLSQQYSLLRNQSKTALEALSRSVAFNSAAAVTFLDAESARQTCQSLQYSPEVVRASLTLNSEKLLARYQYGHQDNDTQDLVLKNPIEVQGERLAELEIHAQMTPIHALMRQTLLIGLMLAGFALLGASW